MVLPFLIVSLDAEFDHAIIDCGKGEIRFYSFEESSVSVLGFGCMCLYVAFALSYLFGCPNNFRDRDRYVQGDYRFRHGYCKHNPRKMVKTWAEKEKRNLIRLDEQYLYNGYI